MASFDCPRCGHFQLVDDKHIGRNATCPKCKARGVVQASMPASAPAPPAETVFYESPVALITNTRAIINGVTYSLANITSASCSTKPLLNQRAVALAMVIYPMGIFLFWIGWGAIFFTPSDYEREPNVVYGTLATSMVMLFGGTALLIYFPWKKEFLHRLQIGSAGGEKHALESKRSGDIQPIVDALSKAIVARG